MGVFFFCDIYIKEGVVLFTKWCSFCDIDVYFLNGRGIVDIDLYFLSTGGGVASRRVIGGRFSGFCDIIVFAYSWEKLMSKLQLFTFF